MDYKLSRRLSFNELSEEFYDEFGEDLEFSFEGESHFWKIHGYTDNPSREKQDWISARLSDRISNSYTLAEGPNRPSYSGAMSFQLHPTQD